MAMLEGGEAEGPNTEQFDPIKKAYDEYARTVKKMQDTHQEETEDDSLRTNLAAGVYIARLDQRDRFTSALPELVGDLPDGVFLGTRKSEDRATDYYLLPNKDNPQASKLYVTPHTEIPLLNTPADRSRHEPRLKNDFIGWDEIKEDPKHLPRGVSIVSLEEEPLPGPLTLSAIEAIATRLDESSSQGRAQQVMADIVELEGTVERNKQELKDVENRRAGKVTRRTLEVDEMFGPQLQDKLTSLRNAVVDQYGVGVLPEHFLLGIVDVSEEGRYRGVSFKRNSAWDRYIMPGREEPAIEVVPYNMITNKVLFARAKATPPSEPAYCERRLGEFEKQDTITNLGDVFVRGQIVDHLK